ncbi:MAG: LamG-like jellyroll fold domain-containing protein [Anaerohalosphaeraceae bacterium]
MVRDDFHLSELLVRMYDQSIRPEELAELERIFRQRPETVEFGAAFLMELHLLRTECRPILLRQDTSAELSNSFDLDFWAYLAQYEIDAPGLKHKPLSVPPPLVPEESESRKTVHKVDKISLTAALISLAAMLMILLYPHFVPAPASPYVGRISRAVNAQWADPSGMLREGSELFPGVMGLTQGMAELTLESGVKVIVQAPADFELESAGQIYLKKGRLVALISSPTGQPFVVRTPNAAVVDFGTEFGTAFQDGNTQTYVFEGEVEIRNSSNPLRYEKGLVLKKGQGGQVDNSGAVAFKEIPPYRFVRSEEFGVHVKASKGSAYHRWLAYSYTLRRDPALVAYYTFEKDLSAPEKLTNLAAATAGRLDASLGAVPESSRPVWTRGRWPEKTGLQFERALQQHLTIPGDEAIQLNGPITLAAWIQCPDIRTGGGHILSNRLLNGGVCNYQLGYRTSAIRQTQDSIHMARKKGTEDWSNHLFSQPLSPSPAWRLLAVTHDNHTIRFYCDGQLVDARPWVHQQEVVAADLWIGTDGTNNDAFYFQGIIDEIAVFKRALSPEEIQQMYEAGRP